MNRLSRSCFVGKLNFRTSEIELQAHFSVCGKVVKVEIARDETGKSKGFAFVDFEKPQDAEYAVQHLERSLLDGKTISVEFSRPKLRRIMIDKMTQKARIKELNDEKGDQMREIAAKILEEETKKNEETKVVEPQSIIEDSDSSSIEEESEDESSSSDSSSSDDSRKSSHKKRRHRHSRKKSSRHKRHSSSEKRKH